MTSRERFVRTLTGQEVDRVPFVKIFGGTNACRREWEEECPGLSKNIDEVLGFEGFYRGWEAMPVQQGLSPAGPGEVIEETEEGAVFRNGYGALEIVQKGRDYAHQTVEWPVKNRADWERIKKRFLDPDSPDRFPGDWPKYVERYRNREFPLQLSHGGVYGFPRTMMGDQNLAYAFYDDPDLVHDMMNTYTETCIGVWKKMVGDIDFDIIEFWEDMCFRSGSFISPKMFREFMTPQYQKVAAFAKERNIPILLVDSDGYIEDLTELMAEAGVTAMYPYEVQSGNDAARVRAKHPDFGIIGALNKEVMAWGKDAIDAEMEKARRYIKLGRLIPGPDHFVLSNVTWKNYRYFMERLREVVMTTEVRNR